MVFNLPDVAMIPAMRVVLIGGIAAKGSGALWQRAVPESFGLEKTGGAHQTEERCSAGRAVPWLSGLGNDPAGLIAC